MKTIAQFSIILIGLIYGTAFSFSTLVTLGDLFYRKVRRVIGFPIITGVIFGIAEFLQNRFLGGIDLLPLYLLHTVAALFLLADRSKEKIISLICAELFSGCMIGSMQTAVFSVSNGTERSFIQVTLLYLTSYIAAALFVFLLKRLVRSEDREPLGLLQIVLLTGIACVVTMLVNNSFTMSDYIPDVSPEADRPGKAFP